MKICCGQELASLRQASALIAVLRVYMIDFDFGVNPKYSTLRNESMPNRKPYLWS
jgi:hypothetical protein